MPTEDKDYLSQEKFDELSKELDHLRSVVRKEVLAELEETKKLGDLSENAEYHEARKKQAELEDRISNIEVLLKNTVIVSHKVGDIVSMGSHIILRRDGAKEDKHYEVVGTEEIDMSKGKLSNKSPIGLAVMGKKKGEKIVVQTPGGEVRYHLVDVR